MAEVFFFNDYFLPMILANCRCHTALSAFSMPNEASLDHNWHSWKIHEQTCFPIIFNCQTFCTNKCCCTLCGTGELRLAVLRFPPRLHLKRLERGAGSSPSCCCLWWILKSPSAQTAGLIIVLPSSLWFGLWREAAASEVAGLPLHRLWRKHAHRQRDIHAFNWHISTETNTNIKTHTHHAFTIVPVHVSADRNKGERASLPGMNN